MSYAVKAGLFAGLSLVVVGAGSIASAEVIYIHSDALDNGSYTLTLNGEDVYDAPDLMQVSVSSSAANQQALLAFCVDIYHNFSPGTFNTPLEYVTGPVNTNSSGALSGTGAALTPLVSGEIAYLVAQGQSVYTNGNNAEELAGIQGAIWTIENPTATISGGSPDIGAYVAAAQTWGANHPGFNGYALGIYPVGANGQGFGLTQGFGVQGVPEPATWAMLILGLGAVGVALRRRAKPLSA